MNSDKKHLLRLRHLLYLNVAEHITFLPYIILIHLYVYPHEYQMSRKNLKYDHLNQIFNFVQKTWRLKLSLSEKNTLYFF